MHVLEQRGTSKRPFLLLASEKAGTLPSFRRGPSSHPVGFSYSSDTYLSIVASFFRAFYFLNSAAVILARERRQRACDM